ncbi:hypothetical protein CP336_21680 [Pseudomonas fluorescens]|jgi:hypothetical protein|nr:hypothetical protein CP336_21680 [Pseudomonas fluorescens]
MKRALALIALYCIGTHTAFAGGSPDSGGPAVITVGEPLMTARARLVKQGWKPTRMHSTDGYVLSGVERELVAHKLFEVETCSVDSSRCILFYSKKDACLRVDTIGEQFKEMTVTRWADECPGMQ